MKRIRAGELAASIIVIATGWAVSRNRPNNIGLWASIVISAIFVAGYEFQIAHPSKEITPGNVTPEKPASDMGSWVKGWPNGRAAA